MTPATYFDGELPSPLRPIAELSAAALGSVVGPNGLSDVQRRAYVQTDVERRLLDLVSRDPCPALVIVSGSAGGGKSLIIQWLADQGPALFDRVIRDATHAESPDREQADQLIDFFAPFQNGRTPWEGRPRLIALNTGMALKFFRELDETQQRQLSDLERLVLTRLAVPQPDTDLLHPTGTWLDDAVVVVNLDHRPTSGGPGRLLDQMLASLDPDDPDGLAGDTTRCQTCSLVPWCFPRSNLMLLAAQGTRQVLDRHIESLAIGRGRDYTPRALWDYISELALGGLDPSGEDPCEQVAKIRESDRGLQRVVDGLLMGLPFELPQGALGREAASADPTLYPCSQTHDLIAEARLSSARSAERLAAFLPANRNEPPPAVTLAAEAIAAGDARITGRRLARAAWLGNQLECASGSAEADPAEQFRRVLSLDLDSGSDMSALVRAVDDICEGLNRGFGLQAGPENFFPTEREPRSAPVYVQIAFLGDANADLQIKPMPDPVTMANPQGCEIVGYRRLHLPISIAGKEILVTMPLWLLLRRAVGGTAPSSVDMERFHTLSRALEAAGRLASADSYRPLLVADQAQGRIFRVFAQRVLNRDTLRTSEVVNS